MPPMTEPGRMPDWNTYFLGVAAAVAARGECVRSRVGAVLVRERRIIATGYNGVEPGGLSCLDGACPRAQNNVPSSSPYAGDGACIATHAEENALADAEARGVALDGAIMYVSKKPCEGCARLLYTRGVSSLWAPNVVQDALDRARAEGFDVAVAQAQQASRPNNPWRGVGQQDTLVRFTEDMQEWLWHQLSNALESAYRGVWSIGCDNAASTLIRSLALCEHPCPRAEIDWQIGRSPLYDAVCARAGVSVPALSSVERDEWDARLQNRVWRDLTPFVENVEALNDEDIWPV